jgi:hypothetical protein
MNLDEYKIWYIHDEGHWYVSKVKQYKPAAIQEFAQGLSIVEKVINAKKGSLIYESFASFRGQVHSDGVSNDIPVYIDEYSVLYICLLFLKEGLINPSHLEASNLDKFKLFSTIQREFIEGYNYNYFIQKYNGTYLAKELLVYYRNFKSWLGKFGFYGEYENKTAFITEMGYEFINHKDDIEICSALFLHQIKRYQLWNPTIEVKYAEYHIRPYYLLLDVINRLPDKYFTKIEYALFITKIKNHSDKNINDQIHLIKEFRNLDNEKQKEYINEVIRTDKKKFKKRRRTNYERLLDSAPKEISCYGYGGLIQQGTNRYEGCYVLVDSNKAEREIEIFTSSTKFIEFKEKLDWIAHLGSKDGLSIEHIVEMYLAHGISLDEIKNEINKGNSKLKETIEDKLYEKEIEDYYIQNIEEIEVNIEVLKSPVYGRQYSTHIGPIDILCIDKVNKEYVIIELKRGQTSDETVGQLLRYMGWVKKHLATPENKVRGILVGSEFNEKIDYSLLGIQNKEIFQLIKKYQHPFNDGNRPTLSNKIN